MKNRIWLGSSHAHVPGEHRIPGAQAAFGSSLSAVESWTPLLKCLLKPVIEDPGPRLL